MATLSYTLSGTSPTQSIIVTSSDWDGVTAKGFRFAFFQDAPTSNGSFHIGVGGLADWRSGVYSLTQGLGNYYQAGDGGVYSWDNDGDIGTAASTTFASLDGSNVAYQAIHLKGGSYETFWQCWASGVHVVSKRPSATVSTFPESGVYTAAFSSSGAGSTAANQQIFYNGTHLGVVVAHDAQIGVAAFGSTTESPYTVYFIGGQPSISSGTIHNTIIVLGGYENLVNATVRDAIAADYRSHSGANALTITTGTAVSSVTDLYGNAGTALAADGYDMQTGAWRVTAATSEVKVGGAAAAWGISGSVTARFSPRFILHSWTGGSTPTVTYNGVALTKGSDYECYADTTNSLLYVALLFDVGSGGVRASTNVAAGATVGTLDISAGGGSPSTNNVTPVDTLTASEAPTATLGYTASDLLALIEAFAPTSGLLPVDAFALAEAGPALVLGLALAESIAAHEATATRLSSSLADALASGDSLSLVSTLLLTLLDRLSLSDYQIGQLGALLTDSAAIAESASLVLACSYLDAASAADSLRATLAGALLDSLLPGDAAALALTHQVSDTLTLTETLAFAGHLAVILSDALTGTDTAQVALGLSLSASLAAGDSLSAALTTAVGDALQTVESKTLLLACALAEALAASDGLTATILAAAADSLATSDHITFAGLLSLVLADTLAAQDSAALGALLQASETLGLTDSLAAWLQAGLVDALAARDAISFTIYATLQVALTDALSLAETYGAALAASVAESAALSEALASVLDLTGTEAPLQPGDRISFVGYSALGLLDTLSLAEQRTALTLATLTEAVTATDALVSVTAATLADAGALVDALLGTAGLVPTDVLTPVETVAWAVAAALAEAVAIGEEAQIGPFIITTLHLLLADALDASDLVQQALAFVQSDALTPAEALAFLIAAIRARFRVPRRVTAFALPAGRGTMQAIPLQAGPTPAIGPLEEAVAYTVDVSGLTGGTPLSAVAVTAQVMTDVDGQAITGDVTSSFVIASSWSGQTVTVVLGNGAQTLDAVYLVTLLVTLDNTYSSREQGYLVLPCQN